jgi:hypothetical protein
MKTRQQMNEMGYAPDPAPAVMHFLTARLSDKDIADMQKLIPRRDLVEGWRNLEDHAKELAKRLTGKEAATPSRTWKLLSDARPEMVLFLTVTSKQQAVAQKLKSYFTKWRQVKQRLPLPEMIELRITPQLPEYSKVTDDVFMLLLDGKLRSRTQILKYLKPFSPPPPPPPPPVRRGRAAKATLAPAGTPQAAQPVPTKAKGKKQPEPVKPESIKPPPGKPESAKPGSTAKVAHTSTAQKAARRPKKAKSRK